MVKNQPELLAIDLRAQTLEALRAAAGRSLAPGEVAALISAEGFREVTDFMARAMSEQPEAKG